MDNKILGIARDGELFEGQDSPLEDTVTILTKNTKLKILDTIINRCIKEKLKINKITMLEKITTDLETSKKLKELGFNDSESEFVYWKGKPHYYHNLPFYEINKIDDLVTCYTLEQIINELPLKIGGYGYFSIGVRQGNSSKPWCVGYNLEDDEYYGVFYCDNLDGENLATTAAKLWIKLKEDKII